MPPGNTRAKPPTKVIERVTVEACLAIVRRVQHIQQRSGDVAGSAVASKVAELIAEELLPISGQGQDILKCRS